MGHHDTGPAEMIRGHDVEMSNLSLEDNRYGSREPNLEAAVYRPPTRGYRYDEVLSCDTYVPQETTAVVL